MNIFVDNPICKRFTNIWYHMSHWTCNTDESICFYCVTKIHHLVIIPCVYNCPKWKRFAFIESSQVSNFSQLFVGHDIQLIVCIEPIFDILFQINLGIVHFYPVTNNYDVSDICTIMFLKRLILRVMIFLP